MGYEDYLTGSQSAALPAGWGALMSLGMFVFRLDTIPFQQMRHSRQWRYASNSRVGQRPALQFIGPDTESVSLCGALYPELTGGEVSLSEIVDMADAGASYPLIDGTGNMLGLFVIESVDATRTEFFNDGAARKIEFTLSLKRADDDEQLMESGDE